MLFTNVFTVDFHMKSGKTITLDVTDLNIQKSGNELTSLNYKVAGRQAQALYIHLDSIESIQQKGVKKVLSWLL